jgi:hypothetical protein
MAMTARCEPSKLRKDAELVDRWTELAIVALDEGVLLVVVVVVLYPESDAEAGGRLGVARSERVCRREVDVGFGCSTACGAVGGLNITSMVGRIAAPKGVERKSEGRSSGNVCRQTTYG